MAIKIVRDICKFPNEILNRRAALNTAFVLPILRWRTAGGPINVPGEPVGLYQSDELDKQYDFRSEIPIVDADGAVLPDELKESFKKARWCTGAVPRRSLSSALSGLLSRPFPASPQHNLSPEGKELMWYYVLERADRDLSDVLVRENLTAMDGEKDWRVRHRVMRRQ